MKKISITTLLVMVFVIGCGVATVAPHIIVPPLGAQQTGVVKWEYTCMYPDIPSFTSAAHRSGAYPKKMTELLTPFGEQGWEVAFERDTLICFKRPM